MTFILGLNAYHADAAACLVKDGELVAAVEEERFRRIKHWGGFPSESIRYCLAEAGISLGDVDHVAINSDNRANRWRKVAFALRSGISPGYVLDRLRNRRQRAGIAENLKEHLPEQEFRGTTHAVEHHLCHLASAFLVSPYDKAVAVSVDGFGDFSSAAWGLGEGGNLAVDGRVYFPHSLGVFYEAMTQFIGFPHYGDEYKVMGLAPYGEPTMMEKMRQIVQVQNDGTFKLGARVLPGLFHQTDDVEAFRDRTPLEAVAWARDAVARGAGADGSVLGVDSDGAGAGGVGAAAGAGGGGGRHFLADAAAGGGDRPDGFDLADDQVDRWAGCRRGQLPPDVQRGV